MREQHVTGTEERESQPLWAPISPGGWQTGLADSEVASWLRPSAQELRCLSALWRKTLTVCKIQVAQISLNFPTVLPFIL